MLATNQLSDFHQISQEKQGILLVDKPRDCTSHDVVAWARKVFATKTIGHTGTLDPFATGLLIILVGRPFTRLQSLYLKQPKQYWVLATLGCVSDTYDETGTVTAKQDCYKPTQQKISETLPTFVGEIEQTVPPYSAVKVGGKKLYELARRGKTIDSLPTRQVTITELRLLSYSWPNLELLVSCSSGTYIRSLIHDLGASLGCGAVTSQLRRTKIGSHELEQAVVCPYFRSSATSRD